MSMMCSGQRAAGSICCRLATQRPGSSGARLRVCCEARIPQPQHVTWRGQQLQLQIYLKVTFLPEHNISQAFGHIALGPATLRRRSLGNIIVTRWEVQGFPADMAALKAAKRELRQRIKQVLSEVSADSIAAQCACAEAGTGLYPMLITSRCSCKCYEDPIRHARVPNSEANQRISFHAKQRGLHNRGRSSCAGNRQKSICAIYIQIVPEFDTWAWFSHGYGSLAFFIRL